MKQGDFYKGFKRWEVVKREKRRAGTEYVRRIDDLGRIVIPAEIRKAFGLHSGMQVEMFARGHCLVLKKHSHCCILCGREEMLQDYQGKWICKTCIQGLKNHR